MIVHVKPIRIPLVSRLAQRDGGMRCAYCDVDMTADLRLFATACADHFVPRRRGGTDAERNRILSCAACDKLKAGRQFHTLGATREFLRGAYAKLDSERLAVLAREGGAA